MTERPILFSGPMVRALLDGRKTQTRRLADKMVRHPDLGNLYKPGALVLEGEPQHVIERACPYGTLGDRLWVREATLKVEDHGWIGPVFVESVEGRNALEWGYGESDDPDHIEPYDLKVRPSIHMPRAASRITLEITEVRVERVGDISEADAMAEGTQMPDGTPTPPDGWSYRQEFAHLWASINGIGSWLANPWVWVIQFRRITP